MVQARRYAAERLGVVGNDVVETVRPLIDALDDPDVMVRRSAAQTLASFGPASMAAVPKLESLLDEDEWTRVIAVEAILKIAPARTEELCPMLAGALRSRSPRIRQWAVQSLAEIPAAAATAVLPLIDALDDEAEAVRTGAITALEHVGPAAAPAVTALLTILRGDGKDGDDVWIRGRATSALAEIGPGAREAVPDLLACLHQRSDRQVTARFRLQIARALWRIQGEPRFLLSLGTESLDDANWRVRRLGAQLLGDLGPVGHTALVHLQQALHDGHLAVRRQAAIAMERIASERTSSSPSTMPSKCGSD